MVIQALIYEGVIEVEFLYGKVKEVGRDRMILVRGEGGGRQSMEGGYLQQRW